MSEAIKHEELVELLQEGKIGYLRFVLEGESEQDYLEWWGGDGKEKSDESEEVSFEPKENVAAAPAVFVPHPPHHSRYSCSLSPSSTKRR